jgi:hypothetical protein
MSVSVAQGADAALGPGGSGESGSRKKIPITILRGSVVCLPEEMHRLYGAEIPVRHEHLWAFRGTNGVMHTILRGRFSDAIFMDEKVRARELQLRARVFPQSNAMEVLTIRSIKDGVVQDLYYYCDVCAIKSVSPEVCACCQAEVVFTEEPLKGSRE